MLLMLAAMATSCTESTSILGMTEKTDEISASVEVFNFYTRSVPMGRVISDNAKGYLGRIVDPETGSLITATYATQFYCLENYQMPPQKTLIENEDYAAEGKQRWVDSCEVRLYLEKSYGEENNPMKLEVYLLSDDIQRMFNEDSTYYTDQDLMALLPDDPEPIATRIITSRDYMISEAEQSSATHQNNIAVALPDSIGQMILENYYQHPENFSNSYMFTHNVFPGLLFRISDGEGTMLTSSVGVFNIYYDYKEKSDTIDYRGITRFAATPEIIQSSSFTNTDLSTFIQEDRWTYIKTPAGIATEIELPIEEIYKNHANDSISLASLTFNRYNKAQNDNELGTPSRLLLLRKSEVDDFFRNHRVADNRTSFLAAFESAYNSYSFNNIGRLIAYLWTQRQKDLANINQLAQQCAEKEGLTLDEWLQNHQLTDALDKDWNKLVLLPVVTTANSNGNVTSVAHEMSLTSIRLKGGMSEPLPLQVVFTRFE